MANEEGPGVPPDQPSGGDEEQEPQADQEVVSEAEEAPPTLNEQDILVRLGPIPPEAGESGIKGIFINAKNYLPLGLVDQADEDPEVPFSGTTSLKPYILVTKQHCLDEVKKMGFASDFHPHSKDIEKFTGTDILILFDPEKTFDEKNKLVFCHTQEAYDREMARIEELRQGVVAAFEKSLQTGGGGGDGEDGGEEEAEQEENVVVQDLPKPCGDWVSETMEQTHKEVANFTVGNSRPPMQVMITRARAHFGKNCKFQDSGENLQNCRPQKDPNFALQKKELETGIQAVKETLTVACQTTWYRPVNKSSQYSPSDFLQKETGVDVVTVNYDKIDELSEFLTAVSVGVEEALQTNETVDIFQEEFAHLGEDEAGVVSKTHTNIKEFRNFHDVNHTKGKRIEWIEWVPGSLDMLACSYCENITFNERLENSGKAGISKILVWSFQGSLTPTSVLQSPWEVSVFKFYPSNRCFIIGGLGNGQLAVWKLTDEALGSKSRNKSSKQEGAAEQLGQQPPIGPKQLSNIDDSHRKAVLAIEFLPAAIEVERKGKGAKESNPKNGPIKYLLTTAGDGQVLLWDFQAFLDSMVVGDDANWKPLLKVQMNRQDSGTEMGLGHILHIEDRVDEKGNKILTNFYASTEEGELILGDWAAKVEEDRKPELVKKMFTVSKTFRPMLSLEQSPFFKDILLGVTDWAFYIWKDGLAQHLFQSSYSSTYFTRGVWSPTRPSVIFIGLINGGIDIWDFSDQSHKASLSDIGASVAITSMSFLKPSSSDKDKGDSEQRLAVGDAQGHLHVHNIPKNLVRQAGKELDAMRKFLDREEARVKYFQARKQQLTELKEHMEKQAQMAADKADEVGGKAAVDEEKQDAIAEEAYRKLEAECIEQLKS